MNERFKELRSMYIVVPTLTTMLVLFSWAWAFYLLKGTEAPLILHWSSGSGITQIGGIKELSEIAIVTLVVIFINSLVGWELRKRSKFFSNLVMLTSVFFALLIFVSFMAIISVN